MRTLKERIKNFKMPHTYVILVTIMFIVLILTHIIPAGSYERVEDAVTGKMVVVPDSYAYVDTQAPGLFGLFQALEAGYVDAADIMFLIIFAYGFVYVLTKNGTMDAALGTLVRKIGNCVQLLIPITMLILGLMASTMGIYEEVYGLFPVFVGIFVALGYDAVVGGAVIFLGVSIGYAAGTTNPYTIAIAQDIAGVELYSGMGFRWLIFVVTEIIAIAYVMYYARKVKKNPTKSVVYGTELDAVKAKSLDELQTASMNIRQGLCLVLFFGVIIFLFYAILNLGWYVDEISAFFLMAMVVAGIISGYSATEICKTFIESTKSMVSSMLIVGFTRGILILMKEGMITDTIVYGLVSLLKNTSTYLSAYGMIIIENIVKLFINGSTSAATITMPILAPTAELVGMSRSIAVLAYQLGHSFADIFWPTSCALCCGLMGVPINKWYKFITPLFGILFINGEKCTYNKQINEDVLNSAVIEILSKAVNNPKLISIMEDKINTKIDTSEIDLEIKNYEKQLRQFQLIKNNLISEIDMLDPENKHYISIKNDLNERLYSMYDKIEGVRELLNDANARKLTIEEEKLTSENIYRILMQFDKLYSKMSNDEQRKFVELIIEEIHIYEERQANGQWIKSIHFKLPIVEDLLNVGLDKNSQVETVVLLSKGKIDSKKIRVDFSLEDMDISEFQDGATYT